jgi:hypothetical protein
MWLDKYRHAHEGPEYVKLEILLKAVLEQVQRYTWMPWFRKFINSLSRSGWTSVGTHLQAPIELTYSRTCTPSSREFGHELWAMISSLQQCTGRLLSRELHYAPWGQDRTRLHIHWWPWLSTIWVVFGGGRLGQSRMDGRHNRIWYWIYWATDNVLNVGSSVQQ